MNKIKAIVSINWLSTVFHQHNNIRILDASWHLQKTRNARAEYVCEHIPNALFFDIDMCANMENPKLCHMLPKKEQFENYVSNLGIDNDTHVVVYDNNDRFPIFSAQRVWWTFRAYGHNKISVVDGGMQKWKKENNLSTDEIVHFPQQAFIAKPVNKLVKNYENILNNQFRENKFVLIDCRSSGRFNGKDLEPREGIKSGCIYGSINLPFLNFMDLEKQRFKNKDELEQVFKDAGVDLTKQLVATCGSGITACHLALAAYICGKEDVAIYDGSWIEWFQRAKPDQMENVR